MTTSTSRAIADDELLIHRSFDAPVALVWRLWEDPEHMRRWWGPEGFTCLHLDHDFRVGGHWRVMMRSAAYPDSWSGGEFREIERHRRLVFTFAWEEGSGETTLTLVTVTFLEQNGRTHQRFHQTPFSTPEYRDGHVAGWNSLFNKEQAYAERLARGENPVN